MECNVYKTIYNFDGQQMVWYDRFLSNNAIGRFFIECQKDTFVLKNEKSEVRKMIKMEAIKSIHTSISASFVSPIAANKFYNVDFIIVTQEENIILEMRGAKMVLAFVDMLEKKHLDCIDDVGILDMYRTKDAVEVDRYLNYHIKEYCQKYQIEYPRNSKRYVR